MNDGEAIEVVTAELLPPAEGRDQLGRFQPGNKTGRTRGSLNRVSRAMQAELAAELESAGEDGNPLVILARLARNVDLHPMLRIQAADRLARYLAPRLLQIELEQPDATFEVETQKIRATLRGLFMEEK